MIDLKTQNPDHLLACVAYCGKIDRIAYKFEKTIRVNEKLLRVNAGFREGLESGSRDETIAKGTLEWLIEFHKKPSSFSLSNTSIKALHRKLFKYSERDYGTRGHYRTDLDEEMKGLYDNTKTALASDDRHSLFTISLFRIYFIDAMPFITGNTLCANIIAYALLYNNGYAVVSQLPLLASLNNAYGTGSLSALSKIFYENLSDILTLPNPTPTPRTPNADTYLNARRKSLLKHIQEHAPEKISDIMNNFPNESRNTIKKDLIFLRKNNLIIANGKGRGMYYEAN